MSLALEALDMLSHIRSSPTKTRGLNPCNEGKEALKDAHSGMWLTSEQPHRRYLSDVLEDGAPQASLHQTHYNLIRGSSGSKGLRLDTH